MKADLCRLYEATILSNGHPKTLARPLTRRNLELAQQLGVRFVSIIPIDVVTIPDELTGEELRKISEIRAAVEKIDLSVQDRMRVVKTIAGIHKKIMEVA